MGGGGNQGEPRSLDVNVIVTEHYGPRIIAASALRVLLCNRYEMYSMNFLSSCPKVCLINESGVCQVNSNAF